MKVLFPIETTARELLYKTFLGLEMASRGLTVFVGTKGLIGALMASERRYIYFDKGFHPGQSESLYATIRARGGRLVNLDEEGAVDYPGGATLRHRYAPELFAGSDRIFFWGSAQYERVRSLVRHPRQAVVTGHPRFHLLKPEFQALYATDAQALTQRFGRFVLVNTNMSFGNNLRGDAFVIANYRSRFPFIERLVALDRQKLAAIVGLVRTVAQRTGRTIVVRPHPEEDPNTYRRASEDLDCVHVCFEGSVVPWILAADAVVHPDCTTAIEAVMMGRPAISLLPAAVDPELVTQLPCQVSHRTQTSEQVIEQLAALPGDAGLPPDVREVLDEFFAFGQDAVGLIVEEVLDLARQEAPGLTGRVSVHGHLAIWRRAARMRWRPATGDRLIANKLRGFDRDHVLPLAARIAAGHPRLGAVRVQQVVHGLFRFSGSSALSLGPERAAC